MSQDILLQGIVLTINFCCSIPFDLLTIPLEVFIFITVISSKNVLLKSCSPLRSLWIFRFTKFICTFTFMKTLRKRDWMKKYAFITKSCELLIRPVLTDIRCIVLSCLWILQNHNPLRQRSPSLGPWTATCSLPVRNLAAQQEGSCLFLAAGGGSIIFFG